MTIGSVEPLKKLHARWGDQVQFLEVLVRQEHPGPGVRPYRDMQDKMRDAERYKNEERIPWPVAADHLHGSTHVSYGGLSDPTYLIDRDGRVAFYNMWTHAPTLYRAIENLLAQGGRGVALSGVDRTLHLLPPMTAGWRAIERGLPQSYIDLETAAPLSATLLWLGNQLRPVLGPITQREKPLPSAAKWALTAGAVGVAGWLTRGIWLRRCEDALAMD